MLTVRLDRLDAATFHSPGVEQRPTTTIETGPQLATIEHDVGARRAGHPRFVLRPWDRRSVWARRVGGRERHHLRLLVARAAESVDGAGERELQTAQPVDEVPSPDLARFLHRPEDRAERGEP